MVVDSPAESIATPLTELSRKQVAETVDQGFARFLSRVELAAVIENGKFRGFRIVRFTQRKEWEGTGLLPGDVILSVADQPIERPEQAFAVFTSLRTAERLEVSYERDGRPMRLSLPIVGAAEPASPAPAAAPPQPSVPPKIEVKPEEGEGSGKVKSDPKK